MTDKNFEDCLEEVQNSKPEIYTGDYSEFHVIKKFGKYVFNEMSFYPAIENFVLKGKKYFNPESDDYLQQKGWEDFKDFSKKVLKHKDNESMSFIEIVELDLKRPARKKEWDKLTPEQQNKIMIFAQRMDDEHLIT